MLLIMFVFSSRRRHTRCSRDWSSDVCSSDLERRDVRAALDELELGVADFQDGPGVGPDEGKLVQEAHADVAADEDGALIGTEHLGDERGGRGLAARAWDADDRSGTGVQE